MKPGSHQIVGVKQGFLTSTNDLKVVGGERDAIEVMLVPLEKAARLTRRWATWKPWLVFGGGLTVVAFGGVLELVARSTMAAYDQQLSTVCTPNPCAPGEKVSTNQRDNAITEGRFAVGLMSVGVAAAITGGVLLYMNRTHTVYEKPTMEVTPIQGGAAVSLRGSF